MNMSKKRRERRVRGSAKSLQIHERIQKAVRHVGPYGRDTRAAKGVQVHRIDQPSVTNVEVYRVWDSGAEERRGGSRRHTDKTFESTHPDGRA
jgi:ribosomal protein L3